LSVEDVMEVVAVLLTAVSVVWVGWWLFATSSRDLPED
jgi:hypothetical protein